jgi:hypothetical protein
VPRVRLPKPGKSLAAVAALTAAALAAATLTGHPAQAAPAVVPSAGPWNAYNYSPHSRTVRPVSVYSTAGTVTSPKAALSGHATRLSGTDSAVTLDFGKDVTGLVSLRFGGSDGAQTVGMAFSESSDYAGLTSDASTGGPRNTDGVLTANVDGATSYTAPRQYLRGGFRYLTIFMSSAGWVDLDGVSAHFTAAPLMSDPAAYPNYFYSSDALLNRIWYAGAYTVQLDTIDPDTGRTWEAPDALWDNTGDVGVGDSILADGAKRDRTVWPGDLGIEIPTAYVAFDDLTSARNALTTLYQHQKPTGELPYSGPMMNKFGSDTYHLWTLSATNDYYTESGDKAWLNSIWAGYKLGVDFSLAKMDANGLLSITETGDSVRILTKGENLTANVLLWHVLSTGARLAAVEGDTALAQDYAAKADALRTAINADFWDAAEGAYRFYPDSAIYPQDGNSLAAWYGLADQAQDSAISAYLTTEWNPNGSTAPENKGNPGVFSGSMEVGAHFAADTQAADQAGVDIIRREWGYMLNSPDGTNSTFWESYRYGDTCVFCSNYVSLAHGWATGPTSALTYYVLGIHPTGVGGATYDFAPHPADLTFAQGRLTTTHGAVNAGWRITKAGYSAWLQAPRGTTGSVGVPTLGANIQVYLNGRMVWNGTRATDARYGAHLAGDSVDFAGLPAGTYVITTRSVS